VTNGGMISVSGFTSEQSGFSDRTAALKLIPESGPTCPVVEIRNDFMPLYSFRTHGSFLLNQSSNNPIVREGSQFLQSPGYPC
jgi:hypothetical protein